MVNSVSDHSHPSQSIKVQVYVCSCMECVNKKWNPSNRLGTTTPKRGDKVDKNRLRQFFPMVHRIIRWGTHTNKKNKQTGLPFTHTYTSNPVCHCEASWNNPSMYTYSGTNTSLDEPVLLCKTRSLPRKPELPPITTYKIFDFICAQFCFVYTTQNTNTGMFTCFCPVVNQG